MFLRPGFEHSQRPNWQIQPYLFIFFFPPQYLVKQPCPPHPLTHTPSPHPHPATSFLHAYARHQAGDGWKPVLSPACCCWEHQQAYQGLSLISMSSLFCLVSWQQLTEMATRHLDVAASSCRREAALNLQPVRCVAFLSPGETEKVLKV